MFRFAADPDSCLFPRIASLQLPVLCLPSQDSRAIADYSELPSFAWSVVESSSGAVVLPGVSAFVLVDSGP